MRVDFLSGVVLSLEDGRSKVGFGVTDFGDRSTEKPAICEEEVESAPDLDTPLLDLLTRGGGGDGLVLGVPDKADLDLADMTESKYVLQQGIVAVIPPMEVLKCWHYPSSCACCFG